MRGGVLLWALRRDVVALVAMAAFAGLALPAAAEDRLAVIIGNGQYEVAGVLRNPVRDAELMAQSLQGVGFETRVYVDLTEDAMGAAIDELALDARLYDTVVVYYAGHAIQSGGENFLVPVDADIKTEAAIPRETVALSSIMTALEGVPVSIIFLDACRNNPIAEQLAATRGTDKRTASSSRGLAFVATPSDMLVAYATLPNSVADDGVGENSPFAKALAHHITAPDVEVSVMMKRVTRDVFVTTDGEQRPQQLSQMQTEFYFNRQGGAAVTEPVRSVLSVYPGRVTTGEELALLADVPPDCEPAFMDMAEQSSKTTPIPTRFFKQIGLSNELTRFEISQGSRYGLVIQPEDARGKHYLGFLCPPRAASQDDLISLLQSVRQSLDEGVFQGEAGGTAFHFQPYEIE